jgi:hypothetical protein
MPKHSFFAEEAYHTDFTVGDHEDVAFDAKVGCITFKDSDCRIFKEIELLVVRDDLLWPLGSTRAFLSPSRLSKKSEDSFVSREAGIEERFSASPQ